QAQLERGARVVEILKQKQFTPYSVEDQIISIWAASNGFLDDLPVEKVQDFEVKLLDFMRSRYGSIGEGIKDTGKLDDDVAEKLRSAIDEFKQSYLSSEDVETVETVAADEGVPQTSEAPAAESGDAGASDEPTEEQPATSDESDEKEGTRT
ncbi:MAG: hypothetical protein ACRDJB_08280, partial [Actinomycetota bacterium]